MQAATPETRGLGWMSIARIGLVQASIGAIVMLATSMLNRVMVVEYTLAAAIPAGLVAWHYAVQLGRPLFGHGSDKGRRRTPWILGGMAVLAGGALLAVQATVMMDNARGMATFAAILAFTMIGLGVGASGTSALALLASGVAPGRRAAAAATTWIMMVAGIVISAIIAGSLLEPAYPGEPFSPERLVNVASGVAVSAVLVTALAVFRLEREQESFAETAKSEPAPDFKAALREIWHEREARRFTVFIFVSMLAYSMQDLILEPFAGLVFDMPVGESTKLAGMQHGGVLIGMIVAGIGGSAFAGRMPIDLRIWIVVGCVGSALALAGLSVAATFGIGWPLAANVFALGFCNGLFAVAAIGAMMGLAGAGEKTREGVRMGVWGASQAIAFGMGGLFGALGVDIARKAGAASGAADGAAFQLIFAAEAVLFILAAALAIRATRRSQPIQKQVFA